MQPHINEVTTMSSDCCTLGSAPAPTGPDREFHRRWWAKQKEGFPGFELIPHIYRLVAEGEPVELSRLAAAAGQPVEEVEAKLRAHPGVDWDEAGRLVGVGLTLRPTPHTFTFDGRTVYAFCASDTLTFPIILGRSGVIKSEAPGTGQPIRVEVTPERVVRTDPPTTVVSLVRPDRVDDVRAEVCSLGSFWPSREAAAGWLAAYSQGMLHTVAEEFDLNREVMKVAGWDLAATAAR
jgi:alkylmercury lyase